MILSVLKTYGDGTEFAPSNTYRLVKDRVVGMTDGKSAVLQAIELALGTERWRYEIFSSDYGCEIQSLLGQNRRPMEKEIELMISEAIKEDDRITGIEGFSMRYEGDTAKISFTAISRFGDIRVERSISVG